MKEYMKNNENNNFQSDWRAWRFVRQQRKSIDYVAPHPEAIDRDLKFHHFLMFIFGRFGKHIAKSAFIDSI